MEITANPSLKKRAEGFYLSFEGQYKGREYWAYWYWNSRRSTKGRYVVPIHTFSATEKRIIGKFLRSIKDPSKVTK